MQESCDAQRDVVLTEDLIDEINLHKYYLSERAGYDVGWDHAVNDWKQMRANEAQANVQLQTEVERSEKPKNRIGGFFKRLLSKAAMM
ncbi:hypothetical protein [Roseiconus lacunae]|uniref:DUF2934 domain-containing protein n=1 Tax=Roseiconus lacunae TaxID=2605694 RepID=A0ABT7PMZ5_9BACT|nr:hypothetical protein [Roseiconus lacunae]MDM4017856.1 hypothetical protein [Roseiconus lacunae]